MTDHSVLCVGETMVMLATTADMVAGEEGLELRAYVGGAESNVAISLAQLGVSAAWWSRLGADPFGDLIEREVAASGAEVIAVRDSTRPTGLYVKHLVNGDTTVQYHRRDSAASQMSPADVPRLPTNASIVHLSGITPALSPQADASTSAIIETTRARGGMVSFDINHRPGLWSAEDAAPRLRALGQQADIVFVGFDEAQRLWQVGDPEDLRELFPGVDVVVKDGARAAHLLARDETVTVSAPAAEVRELVGAGDAFAAGYLAALDRGADPAERLRLGHLCARRTIAVVRDVPDLPSYEDLRAEIPELWGGEAAIVRKISKDRKS